MTCAANIVWICSSSFFGDRNGARVTLRTFAWSGTGGGKLARTAAADDNNDDPAADVSMGKAATTTAFVLEVDTGPSATTPAEATAAAVDDPMMSQRQTTNISAPTTETRP